MKVTLGKLVNSTVALQELSNSKLPAPLALRVALVMQSSRAPLEAFQTTYNDLLAEVGEPIKEEPGKFNIKDTERFNRESSDMLAHEVDIPGEMIDVAALGNVEIKPAGLLTLSWLIKLDG